MIRSPARVLLRPLFGANDSRVAPGTQSNNSLTTAVGNQKGKVTDVEEKALNCHHERPNRGPQRAPRRGGLVGVKFRPRDLLFSPAVVPAASNSRFLAPLVMTISEAKSEERTAAPPTPRNTSYIFSRCRTDKDRCGQPSRRGPLAGRFRRRLRRPCAPAPVRDACGAGRLLPCRPSR
jgi:hypothetical protein